MGEILDFIIHDHFALAVIIIFPLLLFSLVAVDEFYLVPIEEQEKAKISAMSCRDVGQWLITNSYQGAGRDITNNYAYAQAKYLVCTHTPGPSP